MAVSATCRANAADGNAITSDVTSAPCISHGVPNDHTHTRLFSARSMPVPDLTRASSIRAFSMRSTYGCSFRSCCIHIRRANNEKKRSEHRRSNDTDFGPPLPSKADKLPRVQLLAHALTPLPPSVDRWGDFIHQTARRRCVYRLLLGGPMNRPTLAY
jgi:hypothetical protein